MDIKELYYEAENLLALAINANNQKNSLRYLKDSESILYKIISQYKNDYSNMSAVYTTYTSVLLNKHLFQPDEFLKTKSGYDLRIIPQDVYEKTLKYNELATKERESNKVAPFQRLMIYLAYSNYKDAILQIEKLDDKQLEKGLIWPYSDPDSLTSLIMEQVVYEGVYDRNLIEFMERLSDRIPYNGITCALINMYMMSPTNEDKLLALRFCESQVAKSKNFISIYGNVIGFLANSLGDFNKTIEYVEQLLEYYENTSYIGVTKQEVEYEKDAAKDLIATAYMIKGNFVKSYEIRKSISKKYKNNTSMHNMGQLLYKMEKYEDAIIHLKKALFVYEDETSYRVLGDTYFALKDYKNALECYTKSLAFIENNNTNFLKKDGELDVYSMSTSDWLENTETKLYEDIVHCYIQLKDFNRAHIYNNLASEKFIHESSFMKNKNLLDILVSQEELLNDKIITIDEVNNELKISKEYAHKMGKVREWAIEIMNIQEDIDINKDWSLFESKMVELAESISRGKDAYFEMMKILKSFKKKYYTLEAKSLDFLATAEYLYQTHRDAMIDYAPIVIEFSKVIEIELNAIIRRIDMYSGYLTLGEIRYGIDKFENMYLYDILNEVIAIRNKSAHSGSCSKEDMEYIRTLVTNELLDKFVMMKKNRILKVN